MLLLHTYIYMRVLRSDVQLIQDQFYHAYKSVCVRLTGRHNAVCSVQF